MLICAPERQSPVVGFGMKVDEQTVLLRDLLQQDAQEGEAVRHAEHVGIVEVELELRIGTFGDDVVDLPAELVEDVHHLAEEAHRIDRILDVVAEGLAARPEAPVPGAGSSSNAFTGRPFAGSA